MSEDRGWELLTELLDRLSEHFADIRIIRRYAKLHEAFQAYLRHIAATDAEQE